MMKKHLIYYFVIFNCFYSLNPANTQVIKMNPVKDNTIYSEADSSNGKGYFLFSGITKSIAERRALLKFDLSTLNTTDSFISATLQIHMSKTVSGSQIFELYRLTGDWGEGESDAIFEEGGGASPEADDVTWNYSFFNSKLWTNPGGDFVNTPSASQMVENAGTYTWGGVNLLEDAKKWIEKPDSNFGWILIVNGSGVSSKRFNSKDNPDQKPTLELEIATHSDLQTPVNQRFKIFPNPTYGEFFIQSDNLHSLDEIFITDMCGRILLNDLNYLNGIYHLFIKETGIYFIKVNNSGIYKIVVL